MGPIAGNLSAMTQGDMMSYSSARRSVRRRARAREARDNPGNHVRCQSSQIVLSLQGMSQTRSSTSDRHLVSGGWQGGGQAE